LVSKTSKLSRYLMVALSLAVCAMLVLSPLKRGMFFREDYLRLFIWASWGFIGFGIILVLRKDVFWDKVPDLFFLAVAVLYAFSIIWAKAKGQAIDGALKYCMYLGVYLAGKYVAKDDLCERTVRNAVIVSGIAAAMVGLLAASGLISYHDAVVGSRIFGSFQYPNALAAYEMFVSFFVFHAWFEAENHPSWLRWTSRILYSLAAFVVLTVIVLSYSRATWLIYAATLLVYFAVIPKKVRLEIVSRFLLTALSVLAVNVPLSTAIGKREYPLVQKYLLLGAAIAVGLELFRALIVILLHKAKESESIKKIFLPQFESKDKNSGAAPSFNSGTTRRKVFLPWVIVLVTVCLVAAVFSFPQADKLLSKVMPASVIHRFRSISLKDRSLLTRFFATKDAFLIALDNPLGTGAGGWNALYHRYQTILYWFTETHNHFAQVLVETGFLGFFAYLLFWATIVYFLIKAYKTFKMQKKKNVEKVEVHQNLPSSFNVDWWFLNVAALGSSVLALGVHSSLDFDLSLPAISLALFATIGVLISRVQVGLAQISESSNIEGQPSAKSAKAKRSSKKRKKQNPSYTRSTRMAVPGWRPLLDGLTVIIIGIVLISCSRQYFRGMALGSVGIRKLASGDKTQGRQFLISAIKLDPHTSSYAMDLARSYVKEYLDNKDEGSRGMAKLYLDLARRTDPLNLQHRIAECQMLQSLGLYDESVTLARELVSMVPLDRKFYQLFALTAKRAILSHAEKVLLEEGDTKEHLESIKTYSEWLKSLPEKVSSKKERITGICAQVWNPKSIDLTPDVYLVLGQVYYLEGNDELSLKNLLLAQKDSKLASESNTWLYCLSTASGIEVSPPAGFQPDDNVSKIVAMYGLVK